jgi:hypothetical protein
VSGLYPFPQMFLRPGITAHEISSGAIKGGEKLYDAGVVAEGLAEERETINISWAEDKAASKLEGIHPKLVLTMAGRAGALAALKIIAAKNVEQIGDAQVSDFVRLAMFVNE